MNLTLREVYNLDCDTIYYFKIPESETNNTMLYATIGSWTAFR